MSSSTQRILIIAAMVVQSLVMCSDFTASAEAERTAAPAGDREPAPEAPAAHAIKPFVACYEPETR